MFETDTAIILSDGKHSLPTWKKIIVCCSLIICFGSLYVILANLNFQKEFLTQYANDSRTTVNITFIPRNDWEQRIWKANISVTTRPASHVVISHTNTSNCFNLSSCCKMVLNIRNQHVLESRFNDIGHNFLIGGDGGIYVGRGWNVQPHDFYSYKNNSLSVALIGNFNEVRPTDLQIKNLRKLIQYGVEDGKIDKNYTLLGNKQFYSVNSPGRFLYDVIKSWDHWSSI